MKTYELNVSGRVQGVNYRKFVFDVAQVLNYVGYVKNLPDLSVQVVLNTEFEEDLEFFISKLHEGPLFAHVENITCQCIELHHFEDFEIIRG